MELIDWEEIKQESGEDAWRDQWVYLPMNARLLLSRFVQEDRFLFQEKAQVYYGPDSQEELYNAAKIAYEALMSPIEVNPIDETAYAISSLTALGLQDAGLLVALPMSRSPDKDFRDISGHGMPFTYQSDTGILPQSATSTGLPYAKLGGPGVPTSLYRSDTAFHAVSGGLTISAWLRPLQTGTDQRIFQNQADVNNRYFAWVTGNTARLVINNTGLSNSTVIPANEWAFCCWRWIPGSEMAVFTGLNTITKATLTTSVPASIGSFTAVTQIGTTASRVDVSNLRMMTSPVDDVSIVRYYERTRAAFI